MRPESAATATAALLSKGPNLNSPVDDKNYAPRNANFKAVKFSEGNEQLRKGTNNAKSYRIKDGRLLVK
jgi:hypothetical protein